MDDYMAICSAGDNGIFDGQRGRFQPDDSRRRNGRHTPPAAMSFVFCLLCHILSFEIMQEA
jgi:hypothetical protein